MAEKKVDEIFFFAGADSDSNERMFATLKGRYRDAQNLRLSGSEQSATMGLSQIRGEYAEWDVSADALISAWATANSIPIADVVSSYTCIGGRSCKGHEVAFWAGKPISVGGTTITAPSLIQIDGYITCFSDDLPTTYNHILQIDVNESCTGGELFITDDNVMPMIFSVQDMLDNLSTDKYFSAFNPQLYQVSLFKPIDIPVLAEIDYVGTGSGLRVGTYAYAIRYVDSVGNRTQFSQSTPMISVPYGYSNQGAAAPYPFTTSYGEPYSTTSPHAIRLKFRITNLLNYAYIEVRRVCWLSGTGLGFQPTPEVYQIPTPLSPGQIDVWEFVDNSTLAWTQLSEEENTVSMLSIDTAKTLRYYDNRLVLMNVRLSSKDLSTATVMTSPNGNKMYPYFHKLNSETSSTDYLTGYSDPYNHAYHKSYMGGERYGFSIQGFDAVGARSWCETVETDFLFPNRRALASADTLAISNRWKGCVYATSLNNNALGYTNDVTSPNLNDDRRKQNVREVSIRSGANYYPLTPKNYQDAYGDHDYAVNVEVDTDYGSGFYRPPYFPREWSNEIFARGVALHGVEDIPAWVKAFSVLRTKPAGRVVCQGLAFYNFEDAKNDPLRKSLNKVTFFSPDAEKLGIDLTSNPSQYKIQFVQPLGFFSEVYSGEMYNILSNKFRGIDMAVYARLFKNNPWVGSGLIDHNSTSTYDVKFGKFRNNPADIAAVFGTVSDATTIFNVTACSLGVWREGSSAEGRFNYYTITLNTNLYVNDDTVSKNNSATHPDTVLFHEPIYIANIIADGAEVPDNNINSYIDTGHYQKIESVIGVTTGGIDNFELVDERWEDCMPGKYYSDKATVNSFLYIRNKITSNEQAWINIQYKSSGDANTILTAIDPATGPGYYDATDGYGNTVRCYGVYFHDWSIIDRTGYGTGKQFVIKFYQPAAYSSFAAECFFPAADSYVVVRYDKRWPIKVFGGDTIIGDTSATYVDGQSNDDGTVRDDSQLYAYTPMPYAAYIINNNYEIPKKLHGTGDRVQSHKKIDIETIRQMVLIFSSENRVSMPFLINEQSTGDSSCGDGVYSFYQSFPYIHYVQRPQDWDTTCSNNFDSSGGDKVDDQYKSDFGAEFLYWAFGGFKTRSLINLDYSQWRSDQYQSSKPKVGYKDETDFCSAIIWSEEREINVQDSPALKTFNAINRYDASDKTGEIKYAYSTMTDRGDNLYAITDKGVCLLLSNKSILSDVGGNDLGYINADDKLIQGELWLSEDIGMRNEMWRSAAEYQKGLFWCNDESAYMMVNNVIRDIRKDYHRVLYNDGLSKILPTYATTVAAISDPAHKEYWMSVRINPTPISSVARFVCKPAANPLFPEWKEVAAGDYIDIIRLSGNLGNNQLFLPEFFVAGDQIHFHNGCAFTWIVYDNPVDMNILFNLFPGETKTFTYSGSSWLMTAFSDITTVFVYDFANKYAGDEAGSWVGKYTYNFDKFLVDGPDVYGCRGLKIYKLNTGTEINGVEIESYVDGICAPGASFGKEFCDIRVLSEQKPTSVSFSERYEDLPECYLANPMNGVTNPYYLKDYDGWRNKIPRRFLTDSSRLQGRSMAFRISHSTASEDFVLDRVNVMYRFLRAQ